jgi:hypothetical protein
LRARNGLEPDHRQEQEDDRSGSSRVAQTVPSAPAWGNTRDQIPIRSGIRRTASIRTPSRARRKPDRLRHPEINHFDLLFPAGSFTVNT